MCRRNIVANRPTSKPSRRSLDLPKVISSNQRYGSVRSSRQIHILHGESSGLLSRLVRPSVSANFGFLILLSFCLDRLSSTPSWRLTTTLELFWVTLDTVCATGSSLHFETLKRQTNNATIVGTRELGS